MRVQQVKKKGRETETKETDGGEGEQYAVKLSLKFQILKKQS